MHFLGVVALFSLFLILLPGNVNSFIFVSWARLVNSQPGAVFVTIDGSTGDVLANVSIDPSPDQIATTVKGAVYFKDKDIMREFDPSTNQILQRFDCGLYLAAFGYSSNLSELIVVLQGDRVKIYKLSEKSFIYDPVITMSEGILLASNPPWVLYDDLTSRLYFPLISNQNGTQWWGIFDIVAQKLIQAYPYTSLSQPCFHVVLNRRASYDSILCSNYFGQLFELDLRTTTFTPLPVDVGKFFNTGAGYILAATMDDINHIWYGAVSTPNGYGVVAVDMKTYKMTLIGQLQKQYWYSTLSLYD